MAILGHSAYSFTMSTYAHMAPEPAEDAAVRMGQAMVYGNNSKHNCNHGGIRDAPASRNPLSRLWGGRGSNPRLADYESAALTD